MKNKNRPITSFPAVWVPKIFGPLGVRAFRFSDYFEHMRGWAHANLFPRESRALANIGTVFRDNGMKTYYPTDVVANSSTNPYNNRYMLVQQSPAGATLNATLAPTYVIGSDSMCQVVPSASFVSPGASIPLGIMTDTLGYSESGTEVVQYPISGAVMLFCGGGRSTMYAISDSVIVAGKPLIPSSITNGFLGAVPAVQGVYWCVGMSGSTSEGAGCGIELYQNLFPISVGEIT